MVSNARRMPVTSLGRKLLASATTEEVRQLLFLGNTDRYSKQWNDFTVAGVAQAGFSSSRGGTGSNVSQGWPFINTTSQVVGALMLETGTDSNSWASLHTWNNVLRLNNGAALSIECRTSVESLSTALLEYRYEFGFGNNWGTSTWPSDSCVFRYDRSTYGDNNWRAVVRRNGVETATDLGVTPVAGVASVMQVLRIEVDEDGATVRFYIDETLEHTETGANIPGSGDRMGFGWQAVKSVDAEGTEIDIGIDWYSFESLYSGDR